MEQLLVCPFTLQPIRPLSESELFKFHQRIEAGDFYFQKGIPLNFLPEKAFTSQNQVYIYLELDGVMLLQKQTAIVTKNRTENPLKRIREEVVEQFYNELMLNKDGSLRVAHSAETATSEKLSGLAQVERLPKNGKAFATMGTAQVDAIHNLLFGRTFQQHLHFDHDMSRMLVVNANLTENTHYVLCDQCQLPVEKESIDGLHSFEFLHGIEKAEQEGLFDSLKRSVNAEGVALLVNLDAKTCQVENRFKAVKTKASFTPWKKVKLPQLLFHNTPVSSPAKPSAFSGKTSWGSQLS